MPVYLFSHNTNHYDGSAVRMEAAAVLVQARQYTLFGALQALMFSLLKVRDVFFMMVDATPAGESNWDEI